MNKNTSQKQILSDEEIIELYWQRNEKAIESTDVKYGRYLFTIAYNIVHNRMDSEECLNDTYLGTWNRIPPTRPNIFQAFLAKITRNIAVDKYRKESSRRKVESEFSISLDELRECVSKELSMEEEFAIKEMCKILNAFLRDLPDKQEFIFVCRYYFSDKIADIAKMLKISEPTVYRSLAAMREELKEKLEKGGYPYES